MGRWESQQQLAGFFGHTSFAVSADGLRCPLGCVRLPPYVRFDDLADDEMRRWWTEHFPAWERSEYERWTEGGVAVEETLGDVAEVVHVMDREGDAFETFHLLHQRGWSYVIRLAQIRNVVDPATGQRMKIDEALRRAPVRAEQTVQLSERIDAGRRLYERKTFPPRGSSSTAVDSSMQCGTVPTGQSQPSRRPR